MRGNRSPYAGRVRSGLLGRLRLVSDLSWSTGGVLGVALVFFALFLIAPLGHVAVHSFIGGDGRPTLRLFTTLFDNPIHVESIRNSLILGVVATALSIAVAVPLGIFFGRYRFPGKGVLSIFLLTPLILPPFVGAAGMLKILARNGPVDQVARALGLEGLDLLGRGGFWGIVIMQVLHLYPIIYLNVAASLSRVDPSLEEAARNAGASPLRVLRTVLLPLVLPGIFAGAAIVFIWSFTDLGTPLVFQDDRYMAVSIFRASSDTNQNPIGYVFVVITLAITAILYFLSKRVAGGRGRASLGHGSGSRTERRAPAWLLAVVYVFTGTLILAASIPHLSVIVRSLAAPSAWESTILPEAFTLKYYGEVARHRLTGNSIRLSLFLSACATILNILLGVGIAYLLVRKRFPGKDLLDALTMLPLAAPGVVLAFGYITCYSQTPLSPRENPVPLLILGYAVRRLPFMVRAAVAGLQAVSPTLEEASQNLGVNRLRTLRTVTLPLILPSLIAGSLMVFAFAMLEVSDSLILAMTDTYYPLTKLLYLLILKPSDGEVLACALGVFGMGLLLLTFVVAHLVLGKRMGEVFRV